MKLLMTICLLVIASSPLELAFATGAHGVFRVVKGKVSVKSAQNGQVTKARLGSKVLPGDLVSTDKDSRAKIVMVDNNEINISPDTEIKIEKYEFNPEQGKKEVLLNVIYGKVRSKVEQKYDGKTSKFQVKTPSAVAGVRGTDFITGYSASTGMSQVVTFEGRVEFGLTGPSGQVINPVEVVPGQMLEIGKDTPSAAPVAVPQENLKQMDQESKAEAGDKTSASPSSPTTAVGNATPKKENDRQPSAIAPSPSSGRMIQAGDLPSAPGSGGLPMADQMAQPPIPIPGIEPGPGQAINEIIQGGNANLKINVR